MSQLELSISDENWFAEERFESSRAILATLPRSHGAGAASLPIFQPFSPSAELKRQILAELRRTKYLVLRRISVDVQDDVVTLHGHVNTYHERQLAVHRSRQIEGVSLVIDQLIVREWPQGRRPPR